MKVRQSKKRGPYNVQGRDSLHETIAVRVTKESKEFFKQNSVLCNDEIRKTINRLRGM